MLITNSIPQLDLSPLPESVQHLVRALLTQLLTENQLLRSKLDLLVRRYFGGQKNESIPAGHLQLLLKGLMEEFLAAPSAPLSAQVKSSDRECPKPNRPPVRRGVPEHLPVRHSQTLLPEEVKAQPGLWREIASDTTRILDYEPGRFVCDEIIRPRFVRKTPLLLPAPPLVDSAAATLEPEVLAAPMPNRLIEKGLPGVGLLVHLVLSRFEDHLPFYRLQKIFRERHRLELSRQTMVGWMEPLATWFTPIVQLMKEDLLAGGYLQVDETPIRYLDREEPGRSQMGYFWAYARPGADVVFDWQTSRGRDGPRAFLQGFKGQIQCDGYGVYSSLAKEFAQWILFFCVAHWRRKFVEAKDEDRRAAWFLLQLGHLYALERGLRARKAGPRLREAMRSAEARPIWERLRKVLDLWEPKVLPQSRLGKALSYGRNLWAGLCRYVEHGRVEIDDNSIENAIRPTAMGKKAYLFIGHPDAGWRSAVMYSILGSCRRRGINPDSYLKDVLVRLPDMKTSQLKDYTPGAWAKRHPEARALPPR